MRLQMYVRELVSATGIIDARCYGSDTDPAAAIQAAMAASKRPLRMANGAPAAAIRVRQAHHSEEIFRIPVQAEQEETMKTPITITLYAGNLIGSADPSGIDLPATVAHYTAAVDAALPGYAITWEVRYTSKGCTEIDGVEADEAETILAAETQVFEDGGFWQAV